MNLRGQFNALMKEAREMEAEDREKERRRKLQEQLPSLKAAMEKAREDWHGWLIKQDYVPMARCDCGKRYYDDLMPESFGTLMSPCCPPKILLRMLLPIRDADT